MNTTQKIEARPGLEIFAGTGYGQLALKKIGEVPEGFYIYCCGWLGDVRSDACVMEVVGCQFRVAKRGKYKGMYSIMVPGTAKKVYLTSAEVDAAKDDSAPQA